MRHFPHEQLYLKLTRACSSIDALPATAEAILARIEQTTGLKAILLLGGPIPAQQGDLGTHL